MFLSTLLYGETLTVRQYAEMGLYNSADNAALTLIKYDPKKKILGPIKKFFDNILDDKEDLDEEEQIKNMNKPILDKYSPWEILAYNDYTRDGLSRLKI